MPVIVATWETEIRRIRVLGQHREKLSNTPILTSKKLGMVVFTYLNNLGSLNRIRRPALGINARPYLKNNLKQNEVKVWLKCHLPSKGKTEFKPQCYQKKKVTFSQTYQ
jgi:hypothetical protein